MSVPFSSVKPFGTQSIANLAQPLPRVKLDRGIYFIDVANRQLREVYAPANVLNVTDEQLVYYLDQARKQAFSGLK